MLCLDLLFGLKLLISRESGEIIAICQNHYVLTICKHDIYHVGTVYRFIFEGLIQNKLIFG